MGFCEHLLTLSTICREIVKNNLHQRPVQVKYPPKKTCEIHQLLLQRKKQNARKRLKYSAFGQNKNHMSTKLSLSIDGVLYGAGGRTRTGTAVKPRDFKSLVSAIPPHPQHGNYTGLDARFQEECVFIISFL